MLGVLLLGFSSGFPIAFVAGTLQAWLKTYGLNIKLIGMASLLQLPYLLKFLWAPFLDRYTPPFLGRRRGWILPAQLFAAALLFSMSTLNPVLSVSAVAAVALTLAFVGASQDIVIDAYRADIVRPEERGPAASVTQIGYRAALLVSGAVTFVLAEKIGWPATFRTMACVMLATVCFTIVSPEPQSGRSPISLWRAVIEPLREILSRWPFLPLLAVLLLYKLGEALTLALSTAYLQELGYRLSEIGYASKFLGQIATMAGVIAGGVCVAKWGLYRSLVVLAIGQIVTALPYLLLLMVDKTLPAMYLTVIVQNLGDGMGTAAFTALLMAMCNVQFSAFQYALLSSISAFPRIVLGGPIAGYIVADLGGWMTLYTTCVIVALPGLFALPLLRNRIMSVDRPTAS
ncbi:MAG TPA: MFS transporter [Steroidobacteraceae bacterium]|nr:MFS transporter [Steroidobacteraceae bacterium]